MAEIISSLSNGSQVKVVYSYTQDITANTSTVTASLYVHRDSGGTSYDDNCTAYININGVRAMNFSSSFSIGSSWVKIGSSCTVVVGHTADGTKITNIAGFFNSSVSSKLVNLTISQNITLTTIPRASQITASASTFNIGDGFTIYTNRKSTSFTHAINLYFGSYSTTLVYDITDSYFWDTSQWAAEMYARIPNANIGTGTLRLITYAADASLVGYTNLAFTAKVVGSNPTFTGFTYKDVDANTVSLTGDSSQIVQTKSNIQIIVTGAAAKNSATIASYKVQYGEKSISTSSSTITFGMVSTNDDLTVTVIDSRGNSSQRSVAVTTIPWSLPTLPAAAVNRVNSIETGAILTCSGTLAHLMVAKSQFGLKYRFKASTTDVLGGYITKSLTMNGDNFSFNAGIGNFDIGTSFNFDILIYDYYSETSRSALLATAKPILSLRAGQLGIGKVPQNGALDVAGDIYGNYINSSRGDDMAGAASYIYDTGDGFMRKKSLPSVRAELGGAGNGFNADQVDGIHLLRGSAVGTTPVATAYG